MGTDKEKTLFGDEKGWHASEWTSSDDRVRGGKSRSFFDVVPPGPTAYFHGTLDITALGGAGFASQRTKSTNQTWDLSAYDGIQLELGEAIDKVYTLILKDELLPKDRGTGREQSTISYEYDFHVPEHRGGEIVVAIPWGKFAATYRGKPRKDAKALDPKNVKRFSVMIRSFFGDQEGVFALAIDSIKAVKLSDDVEKGVIGGVDVSQEQTGYTLFISKRTIKLALCALLAVVVFDTLGEFFLYGHRF